MKTPIILLTGFLGSGKTTLINTILNTYQDRKISVILNEFGDIKLESHFIKNQEADVIELKNGCMCCLAKSDIPSTIQKIIDNTPNTNYILIEASGLSDPDPIKETLSSPLLSPLVTLLTTICVVDTPNFLATINKYPLILSQAGDSDLLLFSKAELIDSATLSQVSTRLRHILPLTPQLVWDKNLDLNRLIPATENFSPNTQVSSHHHQHDDLTSYLFTSAKTISKKLLIEFFSQNPNIYRAKGYFTTPEGEEFLLQFVNGELSFPQGSSPRDYTTALLFLGENLDEDKLNQQLTKLVTPSLPR